MAKENRLEVRNFHLVWFYLVFNGGSFVFILILHFFAKLVFAVSLLFSLPN